MTDKPKFSRDLLLELALAHGINYDRLRPPTSRQVLLGLHNVGIDNPHEIISKIQEMKRRVKTWILEEKARELGVWYDHEKNKALKLAIYIYSKNKSALEDLSTYQKSEPKTKTIFYSSQKQLTLNDWLQKEKDLRNIIQKNLSDESHDSIATLDKIIHLGDKIRGEIGIDYKKRMVERKSAPQFPRRKGSYDSYPLRKMVFTYDTKNNSIQVSAHPQKTPRLMNILSGVMTDNENNFELRKPSAEQAIKSFSDERIQKQLQESNIRITEIILKKIRMKGNPSYMQMKGENLLETINQFKESDVNIVGKNIAEISEITFEFDRKKYSLNYENSKVERTGDFTPDDEFKINQILSTWGI